MEFGRRMMARKVAVVFLAVVALAGVASATQMLVSNTLTTYTHLNQRADLVLSYQEPNIGVAPFASGFVALWTTAHGMTDPVWGGQNYAVLVNLKDPNPAGAPTITNVRVHLGVAGSDPGGLAPSDISLQYFDGAVWNALPLTQVGNNLESWFGPAGGFSVGPGYDQTTPFWAVFSTDAAAQDLTITLEAYQVF